MGEGGYQRRGNPHSKTCGAVRNRRPTLEPTTPKNRTLKTPMTDNWPPLGSVLPHQHWPWAYRRRIRVSTAGILWIKKYDIKSLIVEFELHPVEQPN